jgi:molecular chaperone Hsp33
MPGASGEEVRAIESHIQELSSLASELGKDGDPLHLLSKIFQSTAFMIVEEKPLRFECQCTWERVERALSLVGTEELKAILRDEGKAEVKCDFCSKKYSLDSDRLKLLIDRSLGGPGNEPRIKK